jgi:hypothetical protein
MGCSVRFAGYLGRAEDRPIERLTSQHCSARGKSKRKTGRFESAGEVGPGALRPRALQLQWPSCGSGNRTNPADRKPASPPRSFRHRLHSNRQAKDR